MTFNNSNSFSSPIGGLGVPGAGFASRGKNGGLKRLSLASPPKVGSISENPVEPLPSAPRTSRSHLLAGLRTAPRPQASQATSGVPASAPYSKTAHALPFTPSNTNNNNSSNFAAHHAPQVSHYQRQSGIPVPHTAIGATFGSYGQVPVTPGQQIYTLPEQVLAPPPVTLDESDDSLDPSIISKIHAHKMFLDERQQLLQAQILQYQLSQQFGGLALNNQATTSNPSQSFPHTPVTPQQINMYNQHIYAAASTQFLQQEVQPGVYVMMNPVTGATHLAMDPQIQQLQQFQQFQQQQQQQQQGDLSGSPSPPTPAISTNFAHSSSPYGTGSPVGAGSRSFTPPKRTDSPADVVPLPPPSANAFRRGHNRNRSSLALNNNNNASPAPIENGPRSAMARPVGMPVTPLTGTFGPGQNRAGEHPTRQPNGPPPIEELQAKPTAKHEGSKNFVRRTRQSALCKLVKAGRARGNGAHPILQRTGSGSGNGSSAAGSSAGSITPVSDEDLTFSVPSDDGETASEGSDSRELRSRISMGSLRAVASGAIGSEREMRKRSGEFVVGVGTANGISIVGGDGAGAAESPN